MPSFVNSNYSKAQTFSPVLKGMCWTEMPKKKVVVLLPAQYRQHRALQELIPWPSAHGLNTAGSPRKKKKIFSNILPPPPPHLCRVSEASFCYWGELNANVVRDYGGWPMPWTPAHRNATSQTVVLVSSQKVLSRTQPTGIQIKKAVLCFFFFSARIFPQCLVTILTALMGVQALSISCSYCLTIRWWWYWFIFLCLSMSNLRAKQFQADPAAHSVH